ncbi:MAG: TRAP transporter substrate-binding protein DctP [Rhizomicrobium sp.]
MRLAPLILSALFAWTGAALADPIRIGMSSSADPQRSGVYVWLKAFADVLEKHGQAVVFYPNSALGGEDERIELVRLGLLAVNDTGGNEVAAVSPPYDGLSLPFLFRDDAELDKLLHAGRFLARINAEAEPRGVRVVDVAFLGGMSGVFNTRRPVRTMDEVSRLRLRAMDHRDLTLLSAWGVHGVQVAWEEVPQALGTGIAEGYMNAPLVPVIFGHTSNIHYFLNLRIQPSVRTITFSQRWYDGLAPPTRRIVDVAAAQARAANRRWTAAIQKKEFDILRAHGVTIAEPTPQARAAFVARSAAIYAQLVTSKAATSVVTDMMKGRKP